MKEGIKTTGQLRAFLAETMQGVKSGEIDIDKASRITKLAGQINESIYSEVKAAKFLLDTKNTQPDMGEFEID